MDTYGHIWTHSLSKLLPIWVIVDTHAQIISLKLLSKDDATRESEPAATIATQVWQGPRSTQNPTSAANQTRCLGYHQEEHCQVQIREAGNSQRQHVDQLSRAQTNLWLFGLISEWDTAVLNYLCGFPGSHMTETETSRSSCKLKAGVGIGKAPKKQLLWLWVNIDLETNGELAG